MTIKTRQQEVSVEDLLAGSGFELINADTLADLLDIVIEHRDTLINAGNIVGSGSYQMSSGGIWTMPQNDFKKAIDRINETLKRVQEQV